MRIANAQTLYGTKNAAEEHARILGLESARERMRLLDVRPSQLGGPDAPSLLAPLAVAYVNYARWVADCPTLGCGGAMAIHPRSGFMCATCLNVETGMKYRLIDWPVLRGAIEEALSLRLLPDNCNWRPGETIEQLYAENAVYIGGVR